MRFSDVVNPTVRVSVGKYPKVRFGAVLKKKKIYGAVRCGFEKQKNLRRGSMRLSKIVNDTVRFGAFMYPTVRFGAVFRNQ